MIGQLSGLYANAKPAAVAYPIIPVMIIVPDTVTVTCTENVRVTSGNVLTSFAESCCGTTAQRACSTSFSLFEDELVSHWNHGLTVSLRQPTCS